MTIRVFDSVRIALRLLTPRERLRWAMLMPFGMLASTMEAAAAGVVFAMVAFLGGGSQPGSAPAVRGILQRLPEGWQHEEVLPTVFIGAAALLLILRVVFRYGEVAYRTRVVARDQAGFSTRVFSGYLSLPYAVQIQRNVADHTHRLHQAINSVYSVVLSQTTQMVRTAVMMTATLAVLFVANSTVTVIVLVLGGSCLALAAGYLKGVNTRLGRRVDNARRSRRRTVRESFDAFKEIRMLRSESFFIERFARTERSLVQLQHRRVLLGVLPTLAMETAFGCIVILVCAASMGSYGERSQLFPLLGLYIYAAMRLLPGMASLLGSANQLQQATIPMQRLMDDVALMKPIESSRGQWNLAKTLVLENVGFAYGEQRVLSEVNLTIEAGEIIGLAGANGTGKSTLLHLVAGLLEPTEGRILVDGRDLASNRRGWLGNIGYVPQSIHLTNDTLRRNIALGVPDEEIDEGRVLEAVRASGFETDVERMPDGLDTAVGDRGRLLSGGQRQRVVLARALYAEPLVLILDEPTGALDASAEAALLSTLRSRRNKWTVLLATHSMDVLRTCDRVAVLRDGAVETVGEYDELVECSPELRPTQ